MLRSHPPPQKVVPNIHVRCGSAQPLVSETEISILEYSSMMFDVDRLSPDFNKDNLSLNVEEA